VTGSDGNWHESLESESSPSGSSDRAFGILMGAICGFLAIVAIWERKPSGRWWLLAAFGSCLVALFAAPLLGPLNRSWRWLSLQLFKIFNPVIMGVIFFAVLAPIGVVMRWAGKDLLQLRYEPEKPSYWLARTPVGEGRTSMKDQF
jgi:cell division protein FtsW (lipid II flippase)